jgi:ADP-ribosylglycohydrolase
MALTTPQDYSERVLACWLGKAVGGTLGQAFEGQTGPHHVDFYDPVPTGMIPNDDLDLQVLWAVVLDRMDQVVVDRRVLGRAWWDHVQFPWGEYGVARRNMALGLEPPLTGSFDNWFTQGMGGAIRSEIWACLAPGDPVLAAAYAVEDACIDHDGEGIWAEVFLAAMQSAAFVETDTDALFDIALAQLPSASRLRHAVIDTRQWWRAHEDWRTVRSLILEHYGHEDFTNAVMNVPLSMLGFLNAGGAGGDFTTAICTAVNCGMDSDCTGATVGALMGIIDPEGIPSKWLAPIGRDVVLNDGIVGIEHPLTIDALTQLVIDLRERLAGRAPQSHTHDAQSTDHLKIRVQVGFVNLFDDRANHRTNWMPPASSSAPAMPASAKTIELPGTFADLSHDQFDDEIMLLRYALSMPDSRAVRVLFSTHEDCRVWLDGSYAFGHEPGRMWPSPHAAPVNHFVDARWAAGPHELVAAVRRPPTSRRAQWVVCVADKQTMQWVPGVFERSHNKRAGQ